MDTMPSRPTHRRTPLELPSRSCATKRQNSTCKASSYHTANVDHEGPSSNVNDIDQTKVFGNTHAVFLVYSDRSDISFRAYLKQSLATAWLCDNDTANFEEVVGHVA